MWKLGLLPACPATAVWFLMALPLTPLSNCHITGMPWRDTQAPNCLPVAWLWEETFLAGDSCPAVGQQPSPHCSLFSGVSFCGNPKPQFPSVGAGENVYVPSFPCCPSMRPLSRAKEQVGFLFYSG